MLLLLHKTLKGSRNIQGFALIRAVLFLCKSQKFSIETNSIEHLTDLKPLEWLVHSEKSGNVRKGALISRS